MLPESRKPPRRANERVSIGDDMPLELLEIDYVEQSIARFDLNVMPVWIERRPDEYLVRDAS